MRREEKRREREKKGGRKMRVSEKKAGGLQDSQKRKTAKPKIEERERGYEGVPHRETERVIFPRAPRIHWRVWARLSG